MQITEIKLPRTQDNGYYLNPDTSMMFYPSGASLGDGLITDAKPWVQKANKQLWVDGVCINPTPVAEANRITNPLNDTITDYNIIQIELASDAHNHITNMFSLNMNQMKTYFQNPHADFFNALYVSYCRRDEYGVPILDSNDQSILRNTMFIYDPVKSNVPTIKLSKTFNITQDSNTVDIASEYIDSISVLQGDQLRTLIGFSRGNDSPSGYRVDPDDIQSVAAIQDSDQYLVIKSTFGTYKFVAIATIQGAMVETHDELKFATSASPEANASFYTSNDIKLYTYTASEYFRMYHRPPENGIGTDVHFSMPAGAGAKKNVELVIAVIDGGEIVDPNTPATGSGD